MDSPNRIAHIAELHQLRGLAAILVFVYHSMHSGRAFLGHSGWPVALNPVSAVIWEGHTGVSLFLVLSGFILATGTFGRDINYLRFIERRLRRIAPLSIVVILFGLHTVAELDFGQVLAAIFLLRNTPASFGDPAGITAALWTVAVEFQFYFVAPFVFAAAFEKGIRKFLLPLGALLLALKLIVLVPFANDPSELYRISYFTMVGRANQFLIGVGLALLVHRHPPRQAPAWWVGLAISGAMIALYLWGLNLGGGNTVFRLWHLGRYEIEGALWAIFIVCFWMANPIRWAVAGRALEFVGTVSFGLYVLHYSVQRQFWLTLPSLPGGSLISGTWQVAVANAVLLGCCILLAAASWACIERPFIENKGRKAYVS